VWRSSTRNVDAAPHEIDRIDEQAARERQRGGIPMGFDIGGRLTREELAWELVEVFEELPTDRINELLAKNVPFDTLRFLSVYADDFGAANEIEGVARKRLPNLLILGYLLRVLEDRLIPDDEPSEE
jgi:hypothetical protein